MQPRPKLLLRLTVPTGGWVWTWYAEAGKVGETKCQCTVPAGNYYMADDQQTDCFLRALMVVAIAESKAEGYDEGPVLWIDGDHKVNIGFEGGGYDDSIDADHQSVSIAWDEDDGDEIAAVLGFDASAADASDGTDNATFTGDYHHAFGWYGDEDGMIASDLAEDSIAPNTAQSRAIAGHVKTQHLGSWFGNRLGLDWMTEVKAFSGGVAYMAAPVHPYNRNEGLECWFLEARKGTPFRVYRHHRRTIGLAAERGNTSFIGADAVTYTDTAKAWSEEPERWVGALLVQPGGGGADGQYLYSLDVPVSWYIESNTDNDLIVNAHPTGYTQNSNTDPTTYGIFDMRYRTYVLDQGGQAKFEPIEKPKIKYWSHTMGLLKYVS